MKSLLSQPPAGNLAPPVGDRGPLGTVASPDEENWRRWCYAAGFRAGVQEAVRLFDVSLDAAGRLAARAEAHADECLAPAEFRTKVTDGA